MRQIRILIVESCPDETALIVRAIEAAAIDVVRRRVETAAELHAALSGEDWDAILSDFSLPGFGALSALQVLQESGKDIPFIVVSRPIGEASTVQLMRAGAQDFIPKKDLAQLVPALERELEKAKARLARQKTALRCLNLAAIVEHTADAIVGITLEGFISSWNAAAETLYGWSAAEALGQDIALIVPPEQRSELPALLERLRGGHSIRSLETDRLRKDGSRVPVSLTISPIRNGVLVGISKTARDITQRRLSEQAATRASLARQDSEAALLLRDRAIQAVTQGIVISDPRQADNPIIFASPGFEKLTGYSQAEVLGKSCRFLQGPDADPVAVTRIRDAVQAGRSCTVQLLNHKKDGTAFWNELSISPVRDEQGDLVHFVGVQTDVTQRRLLEEQYRQAQKMEAVGQLAGGVAHDFNNLLTIINGYSDLLLEDLGPDDPRRELVEFIRKAGSRSAALTRQLLMFSRQQIVAPRALSLNELLTNLEKMLVRIIGEDVKLSTDQDPALREVKADAGQIEQVIMNLVVNARDAMPEGGTIRIETRNVMIDETYLQSHALGRIGPHVMLSVSDTGSGMAPEVRSRIFEPFFTTKGIGKGTGLGLAVVHGIIQQNEGHIVVDTKVGRGTTFKVYLPGLEAAERRDTLSMRQPAAPPGTETVMVVEDEEYVRDLTCRILIKCGYAVLQCSGGAEALRVARTHAGRIHLLITDVVMPELGGKKVAEQLCELHPETKVLFVSGYTDDAVLRHGVFHQKMSLLQKPFSPLVLARKVRELLDGP